MQKKISLLSLVLLIVAAIDSIRNLPATAIFGSSLIFFFLLSALIFLFPVSMIAAEFASRYPEEGGIFYWVKAGLGEKWGLVAIWLQWINTMVWYPTILSFIAGTIAYIIDPFLAQKKAFLLPVILTVFWSLTLLNLKGVHISAKINTFCAFVGLIIPMGSLIFFGFYWLFLGLPIQVSFTAKELFPTLETSSNWVSLIAVMASFLGMELAGVHIHEVKNPQKNFPKALGISVVFLLLTMILGSLAIAFVVPDGKIRLVDGIMQTFRYFFIRFDIGWLTPIFAGLITVGSIGGMINWLISPAKGLLHAAEKNLLPAWSKKVNRNGVPQNILFLQAVLVSIFASVVFSVPSINAFYWFLTALSTELYMIMYIFLFFSALKIGRPKELFSYRIPRPFRTLLCLLGLFGAILTIFVGFFLPEEIEMSAGKYALMIAFGNILLIAPAFYLWKRRKLV